MPLALFCVPSVYIPTQAIRDHALYHRRPRRHGRAHRHRGTETSSQCLLSSAISPACAAATAAH